MIDNFEKIDNIKEYLKDGMEIERIIPSIHVSNYDYGNDYGNVRTLPYLDYRDLGVEGVENHLRELVKYIAKNYGEKQQEMWVGLTCPGATGICMFTIYYGNTVNSNGYPQYAYGMYFSIGSSIYMFGFNNYSWYCNVK